VLATVVGVVVYLNSAAFEARMRRYIVEEIEKRTGATVTLGKVEWRFWEKRIRLEDLVLRGLEPEDHPPLARIDRIDVGLYYRSLLQHRISLYELTITQPEFHIIVNPNGTTNFPAPQTPQQMLGDFTISIRNFNVVNGSAILNQQHADVDLSLTNLTAILNYQDKLQALAAHLRYDGVLDRSPGVKLSIPYSLYADVDYTRATIIAQRVLVTSGLNEVKLQGKVTDVLSDKIAGKLDYIGSFQIPFLNYFFEAQRFGGKGSAAGSLEFSRGMLFTKGRATSDAVDFDGWHSTNVSGEYTYRFPDRLLAVHNLKGEFMGGSAVGDVTVNNIPGPEISKATVNLNYANIDVASLARTYPWDQRYRIYSTATGTMNGWFEEKLVGYDLSGHVDLKSYTPPVGTGLVPLPVDGATDYSITPGEARIANAAGRFFSTDIKASGLIQEARTDLQVEMNSTDLKDLAFVYPPANGKGSFKGTISGPIAKPLLNGEFTLNDYNYQQRIIQQAFGGVRLDVAAENAVLTNVHVKQGESEVLINGSTALSGSPIDLRIQSNRVVANDVQPFVNRKIGGVFAGDVRLTGLPPNTRVEGDVRADNLSVDDHFIGNARGHVRFLEPAIDVAQLSVRQGDSTLNGNFSFNRMTEAMKFNARVNSVNLQMFYPFGLPNTIEGVVRQADLQGEGTLKQPSVHGSATLQNLSVSGEKFPQARMDVTSAGNKINVGLDAGRNLNLKAEIDSATSGYPFTAHVTFDQYNFAQIAKLSEGSIVASGNANLTGLLTDSTRLRGNGRIDNATIRVQDTTVQPEPFGFNFDSNALTVSDVVLTGQSTKVTVGGTIGLRDPAPLNLQVRGQMDLKLLEAKFPAFRSTGVIDLNVDVRGTPKALDLRGSGTIMNASLRRTDFFTSLTDVSGDLSFNQNQIRLSNLHGIAGGGVVQAEGSAVLQGGTVQGLNVQVDATNVRLRGYPEGLRTVINTPGGLRLRGSLDSPLLEGNVEIQSLAYRANFDDFLALLSQENLRTSSSELGRLRLSLHIEGGKNITIQNQLAEVEARVEVDLKGTVDDPSLTGHIEASGGTLNFQGNRYTLTRGNIDFVDPLRIQPVIDIEAESQVRDYTITLSITGRGDNPKLSMRSDPPLSELEIVSLIAGGRTREELKTTSGAAPTSEQLFQKGAANILADMLQQRVGNRLGVLGRGVRIEPFQVGASNNPSTRITLSQQVTKELSVTYSQDISSNRQQVILIEYFVSRNTSILMSRDELGNFGVDLRHRIRLK
jgi:translocation and assembly module TamB